MHDSYSQPCHQLGFITRSFKDYIPHIKDLLGVPEFFIFPDIKFSELTYKGQSITAGVSVAIGYCGQVQIEIVEPHAGVSAYSDFLLEQTEGLHHIGFFVDDYDKEIETVKAKGHAIIQSGIIGDENAIRFSYIDTQLTAGIVTEIIWLSAGMKKMYEGLQKRAARSKNASTPVKHGGPG